jgi:ABC-2 type transport system ATP-binding protein
MEARRRVGYFPEYAPFYPDLSVEQYLRFVGCLKRIARRRGGSALADVLTSCGLEEVARRLIGKFSKGYRQRVGLAQALLGDPQCSSSTSRRSDSMRSRLWRFAG